MGRTGRMPLVVLYLLSLCALRLCHGATDEWIVIDVTTSSTCDESDIAFSVMSPVGECFPIPPDVESDFLVSYRFKDCFYVADTISIDFEFFAKDNCNGMVFPYTVSDIPTSCVNNTKLSCQANPQAVAEDWPGFGFYVFDEKCSSAPSVVIAGKPGCASFAEFGNYSTSVQCESDGEQLRIQGYNTSSTCDAQSETMIDHVFDMDDCVGFDVELDDDDVELGVDTPLNLLRQFQSSWSPALSRATHTDASSSHIKKSVLSTPLFASPHILADYDYYYYADCHMDSLPGVQASSSNDNDDDDDTDNYGGLGVVGLSFLVIALVGVFGAAMVLTHYMRKRMRTKTKEATLTDHIMGPSVTKSSDL